MCLQFLQLLESPSSLLAHTLPTLFSEQCEEQYNWCREQDQQHNWYSQLDEK